MSKKCPVCNLDVGAFSPFPFKGINCYEVACKRCGVFSVGTRIESYLPHILEGDPRKIAVLSHWIRTKHESISADEAGRREVILLDGALVDGIIKRPAPSPAEQADNIVRWLGENIEGPGERVRVAPSTHQAIMGAQTPNGFALVIRYLFDDKTLIGDLCRGEPGEANAMLSFKGWGYYEELKRRAVDSRKAFMAMQYGETDLDKVVEEVFKPAVTQTGFDLVRLDEAPRAGLIDDRLRVEIQTSRFLIVDLTHQNRGAYWEAGYAEGLGKPVVYTCEKQKFEEGKTHFDTNHHLTVPWDPANPQEAGEELKATIRATLPGEAKLTDG